MRILHLIYDHINNPWVGGGGAVRVYEVYKRMSKKHDIVVVCGSYPNKKDYSEGNLKFHFVGTNKNNYVLSTFCYAARAIDFLRKKSGDFDVVIEDFAPYNPLLSQLFIKIPNVLQVHHKESWNLFRRYFVFGLPFMLIESIYPKSFTNVICVSEASKNRFNLKNAFVISNGIDDRLLNTTYAEKDYIAYIGRISIYNKGLDVLIKAMDLANYKLKIVGRGKDETILEMIINGSKSAEKISVEGYLSEDRKPEFIAGSMFVIVPSRFEGQGIVVLEAAACGKPVIVSDIPELKYAVEAGFGISFKTGNALDLAEKINFLFKNEPMTKEMGKKAREYAKNFTWDKIAVDYEKYLEGVAGIELY